MAKKSALRDAIAGAVAPPSSGKKRTKLVAAAAAKSGNRKDTRPHRIGLVNVTGYFDPAVKSSFRAIQMKYPTRTLQDILEEAFEDLFLKYEVPQTSRLHHHAGKKSKGE
ncbi:MAG TPA: ribbon-helix-helix domain-containing protein [Polyangiaceae bacterium]|nr:ribbon-helix-helix domain-containing protein [Polyangiaceae bacterium]